ncbi:MAG: META domain-containing protein [Ignavibacteria bacterium]
MNILYFIPVLVLLFPVLNFTGCPGSNKQYPLKGTEWKLETLNGKTVLLKGGNYVTLNFAGSTEKISGACVCNTYFGSYVKSADSITFSGIGSTKMMCDDNLNESDYFDALGSVDSYKISGGKLSLIRKGTAIAVFIQ